MSSIGNVRYCKGDILTVSKGIILHGCNSLGLMGKGLAKQVKHKYPQVFQDYSRYCYSARCHPDCLNYSEPGELILGKIITTPINSRLIVISGITQLTIGNDPNVKYANLNAIQQVFRQVNEIAVNLGLEVHMPKIGCGLGGLDWIQVSGLLTMFSSEVKINIWEL